VSFMVTPQRVQWDEHWGPSRLGYMLHSGSQQFRTNTMSPAGGPRAVGLASDSLSDANSCPSFSGKEIRDRTCPRHGTECKSLRDPSSAPLHSSPPASARPTQGQNGSKIPSLGWCQCQLPPPAPSPLPSYHTALTSDSSIILKQVTWDNSAAQVAAERRAQPQCEQKAAKDPIPRMLSCQLHSIARSGAEGAGFTNFC